jgi:hypothetical protein
MGIEHRVSIRRSFQMSRFSRLCVMSVLLFQFCGLCIPGSLAAESPSLIPRDVIFGNPQKRLPLLSPDGTRLAYLAPEKGVLNVFVRTLGEQDDAPVTRESHRPISLYRWAEDAGHILYLQDSDGDEHWHVYSVDLKTKVVRDLTPFQGVKAQNLLTNPAPE